MGLLTRLINLTIGFNITQNNKHRLIAGVETRTVSNKQEMYQKYDICSQIDGLQKYFSSLVLTKKAKCSYDFFVPSSSSVGGGGIGMPASRGTPPQ